MNRKLFLLMLTPLLLVGLGYNTLDAMIWEFYWNPWHEWFPNMWHWTPTLHADVWLSYMLGGILPLGVGCFFFGWLAREVK